MTCQKRNCCRYFLSLLLVPEESELKPQNFSYFQSFVSGFFSEPISEVLTSLHSSLKAHEALHQPLPSAECTMSVHGQDNLHSCPLSSMITHCTALACTVYAGNNKPEEIKCDVQATYYLPAVCSHPQTSGSLLVSQKWSKIWEGFLVK